MISSAEAFAMASEVSVDQSGACILPADQSGEGSQVPRVLGQDQGRAQGCVWPGHHGGPHPTQDTEKEVRLSLELATRMFFTLNKWKRPNPNHTDASLPLSIIFM